LRPFSHPSGRPIIRLGSGIRREQDRCIRVVYCE
jgi:hypothetical protein